MLKSMRRQRLGHWSAALALAVLVGACAQQSKGVTSSAALPQGEAASAPEIASLPSLESPEVPATLPPGIGGSANLVGLDQDAISRLFGTPALRRQEGSAEVWQYLARDCVMDAYLYAKAGGAGLHEVTYVEFREAGFGVIAEGAARERCYAHVLSEGQRNASR